MNNSSTSNTNNSSNSSISSIGECITIATSTTTENNPLRNQYGLKPPVGIGGMLDALALTVPTDSPHADAVKLCPNCGAQRKGIQLHSCIGCCAWLCDVCAHNHWCAQTGSIGSEFVPPPEAPMPISKYEDSAWHRMAYSLAEGQWAQLPEGQSWEEHPPTRGDFGASANVDRMEEIARIENDMHLVVANQLRLETMMSELNDKVDALQSAVQELSPALAAQGLAGAHQAPQAEACTEARPATPPPPALRPVSVLGG